MKILHSSESNIALIAKLMQETRAYRRSLLDDAFTSLQKIQRIITDYPKLFDYNGLLVSTYRGHICKDIHYHLLNCKGAGRVQSHLWWEG